MFSPLESPYQLGLEIAGVSLTLNSFQKLKEEPSFKPFMRQVSHPDFRVVFRQTDTLPAIPESVLHEDVCYRVHPDGKGGYLRSFFNAPKDLTPYAVAEYDYGTGDVQISCLPKGNVCVSEMHNSFFHIGFESMLIHKERLCLHAACVDTPLGGILFSGPSGIGKSTQAELWCRYGNSGQINGDRPILSKSHAGWLAWGSPYAGSSRCHINVDCPVFAVVMLQQAKECSLRRLELTEAFRGVWSGLTVYNWDRGFVEKASDLTLELIRSVPVFRFCCTPEREAFEYLEHELRKECRL